MCFIFLVHQLREKLWRNLIASSLKHYLLYAKLNGVNYGCCVIAHMNTNTYTHIHWPHGLLTRRPIVKNRKIRKSQHEITCSLRYQFRVKFRLLFICHCSLYRRQTAIRKIKCHRNVLSITQRNCGHWTS